MLKSVNTQIPDNSQPLQKNELRKRIKAGAIHHAERDRQFSEEWFALEEEVCQETWKSIRRNHD